MSRFKTKDNIPEEAIRKELLRILESSLFAQSDRLGRFLRFTVETTLAGKADLLKEYLIGTEVYGRKPPYHPSEDSIVRSEARRLRSKLKEYYESPGKDDPIFIYYRPGTYVPVFRVHGKESGDSLAKPGSPSGLFVDGRGVSIAVLPFVDVSRSPLSTICAQGITDELIHELVRTDGLRVTAASSVTPMLNQSLDIPTLARKLDVQVVFEGTVREDNNQLRITARIVNADGFQIWSQRFEANPDPQGLFTVSEQIASALISRTRPELSLIRKRKASVGASVLAIYPLVLGAEALLDEATWADTQAALAKFQQITKIEPGYARPFCGIAQCHCEMAIRGIPNSAAAVALAKQAALHAAQLDPDMILVPAALACAQALSWNWREAESSFEEALKLGEQAGTFRQYALFLAALGRFDEAWSYMQEGQRIDPFSYRQKVIHAKLFHLSRRHARGVEYFSNRPVYGALPVEGQLYLAFMLIALDRKSEAKQLAERVQADSGAQPAVMSMIAEILAMCGETSGSARIANELNLFSPKSPISKCRQALLSLALGDSEKALSLLSAACGEHEAELIWLAQDPRFDSIRTDHQFTLILNKVMPVPSV